jgi:transcriptional regulator with XRE-family HTH domain
MIVYDKGEAGKRLTEIIKDQGLNSAQFAEAIEKDPSYLSKMESGKKGISGTYLKAIEAKYGVNRQWLLFGTGEKYGQNVPPETLRSSEKAILAEGKGDAKLLQILANLSESHKNLTAAHKEIAASNNTLAQNEKTILGKIPNSIGDPETMKDVVATVLGLREYVTELAADLKKTSIEDAKAQLGTKSTAARRRIGKMDIGVDGGK